MLELTWIQWSWKEKKGITIKSAATHVKWKDHHINIIDTPGHVDFTIEVERALRVLDGAILLIWAASGVQPQTLTVDKQMKRYRVPRLVFINKLDRMGANPDKWVAQIRERLGIKWAAIQLPIGLENGLKGIIDIIDRKAIYYDGKSGESVRKEEIPADFKDKVSEKREELISQLAEIDEKIEELYLNGDEIPADIIKEVIRKRTIDLSFSPVLMGSAYKNTGVQTALDGVLDYLPNPTQVNNFAHDISNNNEKVQLSIDPKLPFVGLAFKLEENQYGQLTYMRIYQGLIKKGYVITNTATGEKVKLSRMVRMHSNQMEDISEAGPGDIFAMFGVNWASGETFTDGKKLSMTSMHVPDPVMSLTIRPKDKNDLTKFMQSLKKIWKRRPNI